MTYIFESPDGGDTIYRREFGKTERELHRVSEQKQQQEIAQARWMIWRNILKAAEQDPVLQEALDRARVIYELSRND